MKPQVLEDINKEDLAVWLRIKNTMEGLPEIDLGENEHGKILVSCHMICRAFAQFFPVICFDGIFGQAGWEHSWLETDSGRIIDVYPIAMAGGPVILLGPNSGFFTPWRSLYVEAPVPEVKTKKFLENTAKVTEAVRSELVRLGYI
jgi:hypothetical protein